MAASPSATPVSSDVHDDPQITSPTLAEPTATRPSRSSTRFTDDAGDGPLPFAIKTEFTLLNYHLDSLIHELDHLVEICPQISLVNSLGLVVDSGRQDISALKLKLNLIQQRIIVPFAFSESVTEGSASDDELLYQVTSDVNKPADCVGHVVKVPWPGSLIPMDRSNPEHPFQLDVEASETGSYSKWKTPFLLKWEPDVSATDEWDTLPTFSVEVDRNGKVKYTSAGYVRPKGTYDPLETIIPYTHAGDASTMQVQFAPSKNIGFRDVSKETEFKHLKGIKGPLHEKMAPKRNLRTSVPERRTGLGENIHKVWGYSQAQTSGSAGNHSGERAGDDERKTDGKTADQRAKDEAVADAKGEGRESGTIELYKRALDTCREEVRRKRDSPSPVCSENVPKDSSVLQLERSPSVQKVAVEHSSAIAVVDPTSGESYPTTSSSQSSNHAGLTDSSSVVPSGTGSSSVTLSVAHPIKKSIAELPKKRALDADSDSEREGFPSKKRRV